jgi:toxin ParE1/3/4
LPVAARNRRHQLDYLKRRNPQAAVAVGDAIEDAVAHLRDHPSMARLGRVAGTRELVISGTPFILVYRIEPHAIVILRLLHGAQQWPPGSV